jgi:putative ABC transport system permease protein
VKALDRKLLRDLRLMWSQALTIALVVASGVGGFVTSLSAVDSLALARDRFYAEGASPTSSPRSSARPDALAEALRRAAASPTCRPSSSRWCGSRSRASPIRSSAT